MSVSKEEQEKAAWMEGNLPGYLPKDITMARARITLPNAQWHPVHDGWEFFEKGKKYPIATLHGFSEIRIEDPVPDWIIRISSAINLGLRKDSVTINGQKF